MPIIGVYDSTNEIILNDLPKSFVMKKSNGSQTNIIIKDKQDADKEKCLKLMDE